MLRSTRSDSSLPSRNNPRASGAAASIGLCALLFGASVHAQGAPPPPPPAAPPTGLAPPPPPPPTSATAPAPPPPAPTGQGQPQYAPPPQGYGYPQQQPYPYPYPYPQQPYNGGAQSPYAPPPYYGAPYFYDQPPPPPPATRRNNPAMMGIGVAMVVVGGIGFLSSLAALATANNRIDVYCDGGFKCASRDDTSLQIAGGVLMGVTGAVLIAGIPLWVIGGRKVPLDDAPPPPPDTTPKYSRFQLSAPTLAVGPASASLSFAF